MNLTEMDLCGLLAIFSEHSDETSSPMEDFLLTYFTILFLVNHFYIRFQVWNLTHWAVCDNSITISVGIIMVKVENTFSL